MNDWLAEYRVTAVAMESSGVYWIALYQILEARGFKVYLVNARHIKNVPGRKTDVLDCQWIQKLHTFGLLNASFRPTDEICILRSYLRQRDNLISAASACVRKTKDGRIRLGARFYVPEQSETDKLQILGTDTADLIATIAHNLKAHAVPRYQRKVMYDNVPVEAVEEFQHLSADRAQTFLEGIDRWLSKRDRDVNPAVKGTDRKRVGIGVYYFEDDVQPAQPKD